MYLFILCVCVVGVVVVGGGGFRYIQPYLHV